jgi:hypothetical protein
LEIWRKVQGTPQKLGDVPLHLKISPVEQMALSRFCGYW